MRTIHLYKIRFFASFLILILNEVFSTTLYAQHDGEKVAVTSNHSGLLYFKGNQDNSRSIHSKAQWKEKRHQILDSMQMAMGKLPDHNHLPQLDIQVTDSLRGVNYIRLTIKFTAAKNEKVSAYLYLPDHKNNTTKLPAMLVLHETSEQGKQVVDGASPLANRALAKELAIRGYVVIAPDYPSFGELKDYDFDRDRYQSGTMKGIFNHIRCIDLLQSRADVDPKRIGVIGHSLGGHNAMFVGAFDERIKVVVSSCGWTLFDYYNAGEDVTKMYGGRLGPWAQKRYMPLFQDKYRLDGSKIPFDFDQIIAAIAPRPFFSNSPLNDSNFDVKGVRKGIEEASKVYHFLKADGNLQVRYPESGHDFPTEIRLEAYRFIDKILKHTPKFDKIE